jgi:hypothetical protein
MAQHGSKSQKYGLSIVQQVSLYKRYGLMKLVCTNSYKIIRNFGGRDK